MCFALRKAFLFLGHEEPAKLGQLLHILRAENYSSDPSPTAGPYIPLRSVPVVSLKCLADEIITKILAEREGRDVPG